MGLYLCDTCGSTLVKSGEHKPLSEIYGTEIPFKNMEKCPVCNIVANLMYYPNASLAKPLKQLTIIDAELTKDIPKFLNELKEVFEALKGQKNLSAGQSKLCEVSSKNIDRFLEELLESFNKKEII